jgi:phosphatidylserine/phosphatidylglycerophosphate/cardiolipin synthase-like enzyme
VIGLERESGTVRVREKNGKFSVQAISGTYVVLLGINAEQSATKGLLGFAIHRTDHTENEAYWIQGFRTFEATLPNPAPGALVSTYEHPVQAFLWGDYTAKTNHRYTYKVVPVYGSPTSLQYDDAIELNVQTEPEDQGTHAVYFNRGVAGSQAYARKFHNLSPDKVPGRAAFIWLSRGLEEALLAYIGQAKGKDYGLRAAVYEFSYAPVLQAFKAAAKSGADVKIVYDARPGTGHPVEESNKAIAKAGIRSLMKKRTKNPSYIAHNKFIVLLKKGKPVQVWTGSTNLTEAGIFGQSNVGHIVRDPEVAQAYLDYWERLSEDPEAGELRKANVEATPDPSVPPSGTTVIFSPRSTLAALQWYGQEMGRAASSACFTAAFGVNKAFSTILTKPMQGLRYVLLEKQGKTYSEFKDNRSNRIAIGSTLSNENEEESINERDELHHWLQEKLSGLNKFVMYVHTKYLLIDALGNDPTVISGSANFSDASTKNNDENMVVIRGDTTVADIYLGEFMRLWNHFYFRDVVRRLKAKPESKLHQSAYLAPDDSWAQRYFQKESVKSKERLLFA